MNKLEDSESLEDFERSKMFSGAFLNEEELIVEENPAIRAAFDPSKYRISTAAGVELVVTDVDYEMASGRTDFIFFKDADGSSHSLASNPYAGVILDRPN